MILPHGMLSIATVNTNGYDRQFFADKAWGGYYFPRHLNVFNEKQLKNFLEGFGLRTALQKNLLAPIIWLNSLEITFGPESGKKHTIPAKVFSPLNPLSMSAVTLIDLTMRALGKTTSNQMIVMQKNGEN